MDSLCFKMPNESTQNAEDGGHPNIEVDVDQLAGNRCIPLLQKNLSWIKV